MGCAPGGATVEAMTRHAARSIFRACRERAGLRVGCRERLRRRSRRRRARRVRSPRVRHAGVERRAVGGRQSQQSGRPGSAGNSTTGSFSASRACSVRVHRNGSAMISTTRQRRQALPDLVLDLGHRHPVGVILRGSLPDADLVEVRFGRDRRDQQRGRVVAETAVERDHHVAAIGHRLTGRQTFPASGRGETGRRCRWRTGTDERAETSPRESSAAAAPRWRHGAGSRRAPGSPTPSSVRSRPGDPRSRRPRTRATPGSGRRDARRRGCEDRRAPGRSGPVPACRCRPASTAHACPAPASALRSCHGWRLRPRRGMASV